MKRIPFPNDVNPSPDVTYSRNTRYTPHIKAQPPIWPFVFIGLLAIVLALLTSCSGADAGEQPQPAHLVAQQQRLASAASKACGPGMTAIWQDSTQMQCMREVRP